MGNRDRVTLCTSKIMQFRKSSKCNSYNSAKEHNWAKKKIKKRNNRNIK